MTEKTQSNDQMYIVWLYSGQFQPGEQRSGGEDAYPVYNVRAASPGEAARKYVLAHGLKGRMERHVNSERTYGVGVACRHPGDDDTVRRFEITINLQSRAVVGG